MNEINPNQLLDQLQLLARQAGSNASVSPDGAGESGQADFSSLFKNTVDAVNNQQQYAGSLSNAFEMNDPNVPLAKVMIEMQKARLSFEALSQVRNQLVSAYRDIMNMPL
ncbi:MAG: flagellar hook-basal body complex protein FliE [Planctomycetaceae bacterium]|nr:flagellar hook-basal body complex protein FliE [Planctomycetaceae bacterium]